MAATVKPPAGVKYVAALSVFTTTFTPAAAACEARMVDDSTMPGRKSQVGRVKVSPSTRPP